MMKCGAGLISALFLLGFAPADLFKSRAQVLAERASGEYASGDYRAALDGYSQAAQAAPQSPELEFNRGAAAYKAGDYATANAAFAHAAKLAGSTSGLAVKAHFNSGNAYFKQGQYEQAIREYDAVLQSAPGDEDAAFNKKLAEEALKRQRQQPQQQQQQQQEEKQQKGQEPRGQQREEQSQPDQSAGDASRQQPESRRHPQQQSEPQEQQQGRRAYSNPVQPPPAAGRQYPQLDPADVDRALKQLEQLERYGRRRLNPDPKRPRQSPSIFDDLDQLLPPGFFQGPFDDPFVQRQDPPSASGKRDW